VHGRQGGMTQRAIRAIALMHRQETMNLLGFPLMQYIDINDLETAQELPRIKIGKSYREH
jgi:Serine dehydrogenase proteinase